jgi:hypothetical protein
MSAQEGIALAVVSLTAALFVRSWVKRRRRMPWEQAHGCGCPGNKGEAALGGPSIIYRGRKGERPEVVVRPGPGGHS